MPKAVVTYEDVSKICNELLDHNQKISARIIQPQTGGSMSTVLKLLHQWEKDKGFRRDENRTISEEIREALTAEIARHVTTVRLELQEQVKQSDERANEAVGALHEAEELMAQLTSDAQTAKSEYDKTIKDLESKVTTAEQRVSDATQRIANLEDDLKAIRVNLTTAEKTAAVAQAQFGSLQSEYSGLRKENEDLQKLLDEKVASVHEAEKKAAVAQAKLSRTEQDMESLQRHVTELEKTLHSLKGPVE